MANYIIALFIINSVTGVAFFTWLHKFSGYCVKETKTTEQIEYLYKKVCSLEKRIDDLNQNIEDLEEKYVKTDIDLIKSNTELNSKLENFINYNYEILE
jgi:peptidoglycan hydrolase CwlO-like protein